MALGTRITVATGITIVRIALVPFFVLALLADGGGSSGYRYLAAGIFAVAAISDRLDGYLARRYDDVTDLGILLDPIADKALMMGALISLAWLGDLPWWVAVVIGVRELGITVLRFSLLRDRVLPASRGGKIKTVVQSVAIGLFVLPIQHAPDAVLVGAWVAMAAAIVLTVVTGIDYLRGAWLARDGATR